jgi:ribosomal-protein-alanine N-acetyltransferase
MTQRNHNFEIRPFEPEFMDSVMGIEHASFRLDAYPVSKFEYLYRHEPDAFLIAVVDGTVAGYAAGLMNGESGYIDSMATHPEFRGKGIAAALLKEMTNRFKNKGAESLSLHVRTDNKQGLRLYKQFGFQVDSMVDRYYSDGARAYFMTRPIDTVLLS